MNCFSSSVLIVCTVYSQCWSSCEKRYYFICCAVFLYVIIFISLEKLSHKQPFEKVYKNGTHKSLSWSVLLTGSKRTQVSVWMVYGRVYFWKWSTSTRILWYYFNVTQKYLSIYLLRIYLLSLWQQCVVHGRYRLCLTNTVQQSSHRKQQNSISIRCSYTSPTE